MRVLSPDEFRALIAHELANFRPGEIAFTTRFLPLRRVLLNPETSASGQIGSGLRAIRALTVVGRVPARALLWLLGAAFSANARRAGRRRERAADRIAVDITGGAALRRGLMRIAVFAKAWDEAAQAEIAALARGRLPTVPMPQRFEDRIRFVHDRTWFRTRERVAPRAACDHPLDLHSPLRNRLRALGLSVTPEDRQHTRMPAAPSARSVFLTEADDIETVLSGAEHTRLYRAGQLPRTVPGLAPRDMSAADRAILSVLAELVRLGVDASPRFSVAAQALIELKGAIGPDDLLDILSGRGMGLDRDEATRRLGAQCSPEMIGHLLDTAILMTSSSRSSDPGDETRCLAALAEARDAATRRVRVA